MAKRWSINEDIVLYLYCVKNPRAYADDNHVKRMVAIIEELGYGYRSHSAILQRSYFYELLLERRQISNVPRQIITVYNTLSRESAQWIQSVKSNIQEFYNPHSSLEIHDSNLFLENLQDNNTDLLGYKHTINFQSTFPMILQKYIDLKKIKKHKDMCAEIGMKPDTFGSILRGRYNDVKKDNVLRICVGLHLSVSEADELLNSAGFVLSNAIMTDVVIKAFLQARHYSVVAINAELYENNAPMLFNTDNIPIEE